MSDNPTSEELHEVSKQPEPTCPLIDDALKEVNELQRKIKGYEKSDESELRDMLSDVESNLGSLSGYGRSGLLEEIRGRAGEIRSWGEEWKRYALKLHAELEMNETNEAELKPCNNCGFKPAVADLDGDYWVSHLCSIDCFKNKNDAIAAWNTRHQAPAAVGEEKNCTCGGLLKCELHDPELAGKMLAQKAIKQVEKAFTPAAVKEESYYTNQINAWREKASDLNERLEDSEAEIAALKTALKLSESTESDWITTLKVKLDEFKWISVQERFPHRGETVLVYSPELSEGFCFELMFYENGAWGFSSDRKRRETDHEKLCILDRILDAINLAKSQNKARRNE